MNNFKDLARLIIDHPRAKVRTKLEAGQWTLELVREFSHSHERLWEVLTRPEHIAAWAPFEVDRDLGAVGPMTLTMTDQKEPQLLPGTVNVAQRPTLLEYTWGEDLLRWELSPIAGGTRLTLLHTAKERAWMPQYAAGWHICLYVADLVAAGRPARRIVGEESMDFGWPELHEVYAADLGVELPASPKDPAEAS